MAGNKEYLKPEVFNKYGAMVVPSETYESCNESREMFRYSFAAIWSNHQLMNKAAICTEVVRWRLPSSNPDL